MHTRKPRRLKPAPRESVRRYCGGKTASPEPQDLPLIGLQNFEAQAAIIHVFPCRGHVPGDMIEQTCDRRGGLFSGDIPFHSEELLHLFERYAAAKN